MVLTDKAKEDFEKWLKILKHNNLHVMNIDDVIGFDLLPNSMQFGVLVDWADSVGYYITVFYEDTPEQYPDKFNYNIKDEDEDLFVYEVGIKTRQEARNNAIEELNEIYNK